MPLQTDSCFVLDDGSHVFDCFASSLENQELLASFQVNLDVPVEQLFYFETGPQCVLVSV